MNCFYIFLHSFLLQKCLRCLFELQQICCGITPVSYQENRSRDITKPNGVLQIEILSQRMTQSFLTKKVCLKNKGWRNKKDN